MRASRRRLGRRLPRRPGSGTRHPGSGTGHRTATPLRASAAGSLAAYPSGAPVTSRPDGTPGGVSGSRKGPGRPSEELLVGGSPVPCGPGDRYCLRSALVGGPGRGSRGPGGAGPGVAAGGAGGVAWAGLGGGAATAGAEPERRGQRASAMPAAAGDGLLGEPAAPGGGGGAEDAARPAAACEGSFLPAWVSGVPRERLRDFQHHKRVGNYLIGSRKLGEGSFAKVREGLHVLTGEKVSRPGRRPLAFGLGDRGGGDPAESPALRVWLRSPGRAPPAPSAFPLGLKAGSSQTRAQTLAAGIPAFPEGRSGVTFPRGRLVSPRSRPQPFLLLEGRRLADTGAGVGWAGGCGTLLSRPVGAADQWRGWNQEWSEWALTLRVGELISQPLGELRV